MSKQSFRFVAVGGIGFVVDGGTTFALVSLGFSPVTSRIPALALAILTTWLLNRCLTFEVRRPRSTNELLRYFGVALSSAAMNFGAYTLLVLSGVKPGLAVAIATLLLMFFSFYGYKLFIFRMRR